MVIQNASFQNAIMIATDIIFRLFIFIKLHWNVNFFQKRIIFLESNSKKMN